MRRCSLPSRPFVLATLRALRPDLRSDSGPTGRNITVDRSPNCSRIAHVTATAQFGDIGRRVKAAREEAGRTQEDLASAVRMERSALAKVETGARRVSAVELSEIATALDARIEWFLEDAPRAVLSRRNARDPGRPSPTIDRLTERVAREVEFVMLRDETLGAIGTPESLTHPRNRAGAEQAAITARQLLGLESTEPAINLSARVAKLGLFAFSLDTGRDSADGASMLLTTGGVAVVNGQLQVGRRRLTLAHEFGHYLFADPFSLDWDVADSHQSVREARIDHFARALLVPAEGLKEFWTSERRSRSTRDAAVILGSHFRVDMSTLSRRLLELAIVNAPEAELVRAVRTTKADIVDFELYVPQELSTSELPRNYTEAVLRLYRNQTVSGVRAVDLLLDTWAEEDLPDLPTLPESAIWSFVS